MRTTTETFLEQSRAYLLRGDRPLQQDARSDLVARTDWPQPGNRRATRSRKDSRRGRGPRPG